MEILPPLLRIIHHAHGFALEIRIHQSDRKDVASGVDASVVAETQRPVNCRVRDGAPYIDDLEPTLEKGFCFIGWEMAPDAGDGRIGGLVDVGLGHGLAPIWGIVNLIGPATADGWNSVNSEVEGGCEGVLWSKSTALLAPVSSLMSLVVSG